MASNPDNGYAYSPVELTAIMHIAVDINATHLAEDSPIGRRWTFFQQAFRMPNNPDKESDKKIADLLTRAILAEVEDPKPASEAWTDNYFEPHDR